ncbi:MAG: glucosaminidase domain-containing protein [Bacteroidales bacterium]|nr:glucosaminidase domain-containing protein [Bacteroidales bacterium]HPD96213.1 glucosaminidase domain-containing protein [Tenuifilaceae bacterium]HRX31798.1 glucosaminidase domain-containing protein [Tenuifilaceae bacterium]
MVDRYLLVFALLFQSIVAFSQDRLSREEYIEKYSPIAINNMKKYGIPASITLAQALLESDNGNSELARKANNHFGIKCHNDWTGAKMYHDDDRKHECFRKYDEPEKSFFDHSQFLLSAQRYAFLFKLGSTDYKAWAHGLKKAGYATNPRYPQLLIKIIEDNNLSRFDTGVSVAQVNKPSRKKSKNLDNYVIDIYNTREVYVRNRIKYIVVEDGDTYESLTKEFDLMPWQLFKYNDLTKDSTLKAGQELYIQPKRRRAARGNSTHKVEAGETMYQISQQYGVRLKLLYRKNYMRFGEQPHEGDVLYLRRKKPL